MTRMRTRAQLSERVLRVSGIGSDDPVRVNRFISEAWGMVWNEMVEGLDGFGQITQTLVVPDTQPVTLPALFLKLQAMVLRKGGNAGTWIIPDLTTRQKVGERGPYIFANYGSQQYYMIEGSGQEPDGLGGVQKYVARMRFWPPLAATDELDLTYVTQEPSLGDPEDPADDSSSIDVLSEPVERAIIGFSRLGVTTRLKDTEYDRAARELILAVKASIKTYIGYNQQGARRLRDY